MGARWEKRELCVGGHRFLPGSWTTEVSDRDRWVIWKGRQAIDELIGLVEDFQPKRIVEVGVGPGGSTALLAELCPDAQILAVDISDPIPLLDEYAASREGVEVRWGVDQHDTGTLSRLMGETFGGEPVDLVIDDAYHSYEGTAAAMSVLFPHVRPGGCYVVEDWAWCHFDPSVVAELAWMVEAKPLLQLVLELVGVCGATRGGVVGRVDVRSHAAYVWRGESGLSAPFWPGEHVPMTRPVGLPGA